MMVVGVDSQYSAISCLVNLCSVANYIKSLPPLFELPLFRSKLLDEFHNCEAQLINLLKKLEQGWDFFQSLVEDFSFQQMRFHYFLNKSPKRDIFLPQRVIDAQKIVLDEKVATSVPSHFQNLK